MCDMVTVVAVFDRGVLKASTWHWMQSILNSGGGACVCVCVSAWQNLCLKE